MHVYAFTYINTHTNIFPNRAGAEGVSRGMTEEEMEEGTLGRATV